MSCLSSVQQCVLVYKITPYKTDHASSVLARDVALELRQPFTSDGNCRTRVKSDRLSNPALFFSARLRLMMQSTMFSTSGIYTCRIQPVLQR